MHAHTHTQRQQQDLIAEPYPCVAAKSCFAHVDFPKLIPNLRWWSKKGERAECQQLRLFTLRRRSRRRLAVRMAQTFSWQHCVRCVRVPCSPLAPERLVEMLGFVGLCVGWVFCDLVFCCGKETMVLARGSGPLHREASERCTSNWLVGSRA